MSWAPHVTVATLVEHQGRFLTVREWADEREVYNQPAGHLEPNESLLEAATRETLEETGWHVRPTHLLSLSLYRSPINEVTYARHTFLADPVRHEADRRLDEDILAAEWLSHAELRERREQLRSPLVLEAVEDFLGGTRYPLEILRTHL